MKPSVAIALIVCGTLLIMTPAVYNYALQRSVESVLLQRTDFMNYTGGVVMSSAYEFVCWATGAAMVGIAVLLSVRFPATSASTPRPATV